MSTTCPKCHHVRQAMAEAPAWQCPACGVAYAKASEASNPSAKLSTVIYQATPDRRFGWRKWIAVAAVACGAWAGLQISARHHRGDGGDAISSLSANPSNADLHALAANVKADEVVMYSTTECTYCAQAKSWLGQNGFAFTECNMSVSSRCEHEFRSYGGTGTPYLVVRGHHMKDGFDSDQFVALLGKQ